jgi:plastocyanin
LLVGLMAVGLLVILAACGGDDDDSAAPPATAAPAATSASSAAGTATTAGASTGAAAGGSTEVIKQVSFTVKEVHVAVGGTVVFDNQDTQAHTATADDGSFDTGSIAAGSQKTVTFPKAGTFAFHCSFHPFMKATVVVA